VVVAAISQENGELVSGPEILSRGFVYIDQSEELIAEATDTVRDILRSPNGDGPRSPEALQSEVRSSLRRLLEKRTNRRPMVLPLIMEM